jgi:hypothetical protein
MGLFDSLRGKPAEQKAREAQDAHRQTDIAMSLRGGRVPTDTLSRLQNSAAGKLPWMATLTPAELLVARSHGLRPIAAVCAACAKKRGPAAPMRCWT